MLPRKPGSRVIALSVIGVVVTIILIIKGIPLILKPTLLQQVQNSGELIIATRNSPTTYYEGPDGPTGFEYDLARMFADSLGVELKVVVPDNINDIFRHVEKGKVHLAAAGLTVTDARKQRVRFSPSYQQITEQLVYHNKNSRPNSVNDLDQGMLEVIADSSHVDRLQQLKQQHTQLNWVEHNDVESEELLQMVNNHVIDYTIADSNEVAMNQRFLIDLRVAFNLSEPLQLAWAFSNGRDTSLYDKASEFFWKIYNNGELSHLIEQHYGHVDKFDYVGNRTYIEHIATRLSKYQTLFQQASAEVGMDWRLLAAMGYQESHWNPEAISPTGVRGIMMLTRQTAAQLGVSNRLDPHSSIYGGARYLAEIRNRLPPEIEEPDRTWFALAAYNVGYYHVEDARAIAVQLNKNPNKWNDVRTTLPLLTRSRWYKVSTYGYARGWEPVRYVEGIRRYYDLLNYQTKDLPDPNDDHGALSIMPSVL
jgi:membrane-bound lytic murein transglycosylase F